MHAVELASLPGWATNSFIEEGHVYSKRASQQAPEVEMVQAIGLVLDDEAGTVSCRITEEPTIWIPDKWATEGMTLTQARQALAGLQELLGVLDAESGVE